MKKFHRTDAHGARLAVEAEGNFWEYQMIVSRRNSLLSAAAQLLFDVFFVFCVSARNVFDLTTRPGCGAPGSAQQLQLATFYLGVLYCCSHKVRYLTTFCACI